MQPIVPVLPSDILMNMPVVKCPQCGAKTDFEGNEFRPFCSERCKLLDFGAWADERYSIPAESEPLTDEDIDAVEKAMEKQEE